MKFLVCLVLLAWRIRFTQGQDAIVPPRPDTGLYFLLNDTVILPGDSILITDIGKNGHLACVTTNVNTQCCNNGDNSSMWLFPNGSVVTHAHDYHYYYYSPGFYITSSSEQIRLNRYYGAIMPFGVYTCRVRSENSSVIHSANISILLRGATPPSTGLYFVFNEIVYLPGDTLMITDIGSWSDYTDPRSSLVCISSNVNTQCCRRRDGGNVGEWFFPNGAMVIRNSYGHGSDFTRKGFTQQVRLNRRNNAVAPFGVYTCRIPDGRNSSVIHSANITLLLNGATPPSTGLYFVFNKTVYLPGDTLRITDIGSASIYYYYTDPQFSLVCISTDNNVGEWLFPNGSMVPYDTNGDFTSLRSNLTQKAFLNRRNNAAITPFGVYTCRVPDGNSSVIHSASISLLLYNGFLLSGVFYPNNSVVSLRSIREGSAALYCLTNSTTCCQSADIGQWTLSNGYIPDNFSDGFYSERGSSVVLLNRQANELGPTGVYTCQVPDASGVKRTMYIGVDSGIPAITSFDYDRATLTLTCVSSGGPVDSVTWMKDGVKITGDDPDFSQSQTITNASSATYQHTLFVQNVIYFVGRFTCIVRDVAGNNDTRDLTTCPVGHYISQTYDNYSACVPCPRYSTTSPETSEMCKCLRGYFRSPLEDIHVPCTRPPSACTSLIVDDRRTRENSITVRWNRPAITGREDYYYNIHHSNPDLPGSFVKHNSNPYISTSPILQYTVSGLRPLTNYTIRVTVHNGVSDQDLAGEEKRWCEVAATSGNIHAEAPRSVGSFRCVVYWKAPSRAYGVITGYEVSFFLPGRENESVVVRKESDEIFHIVKDGDLESVQGDTRVKVRAKTVSTNGAWSDPITLDCPSAIPPS